VDDGSATLDRPGSSHDRVRQEPGFILEDDVRADAPGFFLRRGHSDRLAAQHTYSNRSRLEFLVAEFQSGRSLNNDKTAIGRIMAGVARIG